MFCSECGQRNIESARFCAGCGGTLKLKNPSDQNEFLSDSKKPIPLVKPKHKQSITAITLVILMGAAGLFGIYNNSTENQIVAAKEKIEPSPIQTLPEIPNENESVGTTQNQKYKLIKEISDGKLYLDTESISAYRVEGTIPHSIYLNSKDGTSESFEYNASCTDNNREINTIFLINARHSQHFGAGEVLFYNDQIAEDDKYRTLKKGDLFYDVLKMYCPR